MRKYVNSFKEYMAKEQNQGKYVFASVFAFIPFTLSMAILFWFQGLHMACVSMALMCFVGIGLMIIGLQQINEKYGVNKKNKKS